MAKSTAIVLFFTAGMLPTAVELSQISRLETAFRSVKVRRSDVAADTLLGTRIETCNYVAGVNIPAAYTDADKGNKPTIALPSDINPDDFKVFPAILTIDASDVDVQTPAAVKAEIDATTGKAKMTNLTGDATVTWASSDATKATVNASTGKITAVAAGSTNITATLQASASITGVAAAAATDLFTKAAHGLALGDAVDLLALGSGTGFGSIGNTRYVIPVSADTFKLATSYANAVAGTAIDVTGDATNATICRARVSAVMALTVQA